MEKNIKDDISSNDKSSNSSRIRSNDIDEFSANKDPNFNPYLDPKNYDISSNLSDLYNPNNNENESEKEVRYVIVNNPLLELYKSKDAIIKIEYNDCCCCSEYNNLYMGHNNACTVIHKYISESIHNYFFRTLSEKSFDPTAGYCFIDEFYRELC